MSQDQDMIPTKEGYKVEKCLGLFWLIFGQNHFLFELGQV